MKTPQQKFIIGDNVRQVTPIDEKQVRTVINAEFLKGIWRYKLTPPNGTQEWWWQDNLAYIEQS